MSNQIEQQIIDAEERLRLAMLNSDVKALDELLAEELIFTNHFGQVMSKGDDLEAHASGILNIEELTLSEQIIRIVGEVAIVSVRARILGSFADNRSEDDFRFTRVWTSVDNDSWQVVAGHSSLVAV